MAGRRKSPGTDGEARGPSVTFAGLCDECGTGTTRVATDGKPRHAGCDIEGHQVTISEAIDELIHAGILPDDSW